MKLDTVTGCLGKAALLGIVLALAGCDNSASEPSHPGKAVYERYCYACHQAGVAGAPKLGDPSAWERRLAQGTDVLYENVKQGMTPGMPPRGACPACTDQALEAAVDYMVENAN